MFVVHSPMEEMFSKKAMIISTTAGAGTGAAIKTVETSMKFWGVNRVRKLGFAIWSADIDSMKPARKSRFMARLSKSAAKFYREAASGKKRRPYFITWFMFHVARRMISSDRSDTADAKYWREKGWFERTPF